MIQEEARRSGLDLFSLAGERRPPALPRFELIGPKASSTRSAYYEVLDPIYQY
jgi:hypothetical protein